jgi:hypothetical protein
LFKTGDFPPKNVFSTWTHLDIKVVLSKLDNFPQIDAEEYYVKPTRRYHIALSIQDSSKRGLKIGTKDLLLPFANLSKRGMFSLPEVVQVDIEITPDSGGGHSLLTLFQRQMF